MHSSTYKVMNKQYYIQKAATNRRNNKKTAYKIQLYNNRLVDDIILNQNNGYQKPTHSMLYADIEALLKPQVYNNYNRLMKSPYIRNDTIQSMLIQNKAQKDLNSIVEKELARVTNNLNYVEKVVQKYEVPKTEYQKLLDTQKENSIRNRRQVWEEVARQANNLNASEGLNIKMPEPYINLDTFTENLMRQNKMTSEWETYQEENRLSEEAGDGTLYDEKVWIHTDAGKTTRHASNHMQTVPFNETFVILNDDNGDIDEIDHPCDPNGSPSNCAICYCEMEVRKKV